MTTTNTRSAVELGRECGYNRPVGTRCPICAKWPYAKGGASAYNASLSPTAPTLIEAATAEQGAVGREEIAGVIRDQMREQWDDICADTNCHPLDLQHGRGSVLHYKASHWTDAVAQISADAILALRPSASTGGEYQRGIGDAAKVADGHAAMAGEHLTENYRPAHNSGCFEASKAIASAIRALAPTPKRSAQGSYAEAIQDAAKVITDGAITEGWARANDVREILESYARQIRALTPSPVVAEVEGEWTFKRVIGEADRAGTAPVETITVPPEIVRAISLAALSVVPEVAK